MMVRSPFLYRLRDRTAVASVPSAHWSWHVEMDRVVVQLQFSSPARALKARAALQVTARSEGVRVELTVVGQVLTATTSLAGGRLFGMKTRIYEEN